MLYNSGKDETAIAPTFREYNCYKNRTGGTILNQRLPPPFLIFFIWDSTTGGAILNHHPRNACLDPRQAIASVIEFYTSPRNPCFLLALSNK